MNSQIDQPSGMTEAIAAHAIHLIGKPWDRLLPHERLQVVVLAIRDRAMELAVNTEQRYRKAGIKRAYYLSLECLIGRLLGSALLNLGIYNECADAVRELGGDLSALIEIEADAGLGNGGLGRLAACLLDSLATLDMPGFGYSLNYDYGLFRQTIVDGRQVEQPDDWKRHGAPWEATLTEECIRVPLRGRVIYEEHPAGQWKPRWVDTTVILGRPYDIPIIGYGAKTVNMLRLFSAAATEDFDIHAFNEGRYIDAMHSRDLVETITKVLYPNDSVPNGPELRLVQEYFLVACSIGDILRDLGQDFDMRQLPDRVAMQMNDTHPSLAVAELMRVMVDERDISWDEAWDATTNTLGFTNHTLMPEALEKWPVDLMEKVLPRHLEIIYEINRRLLEQVAQKYPGDYDRIRQMSLIEEGAVKKVHMAQLAIVGSHSVNGVAKVHSELIKSQLVPDFYQFSPQKFNNKTNGVTPRRWLAQCNPDLAALLTELIGSEWITDLSKLSKFAGYSTDTGVRDRFSAVQRQNKARLSAILESLGIHALDPDAMVDVQIKRIHEYKRQLLHILYVVHQYLKIAEDNDIPAVSRVHIFAGKAAPGYQTAKDIIYFINAIAGVIDRDKRCDGRLRVIFVPDYRVTLAEKIIPAADLSEQISTAGTEASGTSNMKLAINGALTIGTLDGANVEIRDEIGDDNVFIFGNTIEQIAELRIRGANPREFYDSSPRIQRIMNAFHSDILSPGQPGLHSWVFGKLVDSWDMWFNLADLDSYIDTQERLDQLYQQPGAWAEKAILNVALSGYFSSDRTVTEYARDIWGIGAMKDV